MKFPFSWKKKSVSTTDQPTREPEVKASDAAPEDKSVLEETVEPPRAEETQDTQPGLELAAEQLSASTTKNDDSALWFSPAEVATLASLDDGKDLAARISSHMPNQCREEQLFRYQLSKSVFLEEFEIPVLPQSATGVMALSRNAKATIKDYVDLVQPDASLAREVLATINSSYYGGREPINSLHQAIARLGLREVERVALVHTMKSKLFRVAGFEDLLDSLVHHNVSTALVAQLLAKRKGVAVEDAGLAGLFHDVGKLVLLSIVGAVQHKLRWTATEDIVESCFKAFHVRVGELACTRWEFPEDVIAAVASHQDAEQAAESTLSRVVFVANLVARALDQAKADEDDAALYEHHLAGHPLVEETLGSGSKAIGILEEAREAIGHAEARA